MGEVEEMEGGGGREREGEREGMREGGSGERTIKAIKKRKRKYKMFFLLMMYIRLLLE